MSESSPPSASAATVERDELVEYLDSYLDAGGIEDYCPNGLQVEGSPVVGRIVTGVSACRELFERARELEAAAIIVHHGIFWRGASSRLTGYQYHRVAELIRGDLNLFAYHLPLDRHPELGNNALAVAALGLEQRSPFGMHQGVAIGFRGSFPSPLAASELVSRCREVFGQKPLAFLAGPDPVRSVGVVSGAAESSLHEAIAEGLDAYITGEASEWVMNISREAGVSFLAAGHYATERLGIRALGEHLADHFGVDVHFVDIPNPV